MLTLPQPGTRVTLSVAAEIDPHTGHQLFNHYVGHVVKWIASSAHPRMSDVTLVLRRDSSADGRRPSEMVRIPATHIRFLKTVPERSTYFRKREDGTQNAKS